MEHYFYKKTGLGTIYSRIKVHSDGSVSAYGVLNGNELYFGEYRTIAHAEAYYITHGYSLI